MRYQITHGTTYRYAQPVTLHPHVVRLRPRSDASQFLHRFQLDISPDPLRLSDVLDAGNHAIAKLWFLSTPTEQLRLTMTSEVETLRVNPFDLLLEPWAVKLPLDYPSALLHQLQPYLSTAFYPLDPIAFQLGQEVNHQVQGDVVSFLTELNLRIHRTCQYTLRETGDPWTPGITWQQQQGSCRDLAILLVEACRAVGLAARFVSGYHEGDPQQESYLHAWAEIFLPGGGWRGYDPTLGLAVADRHIALVASPHYQAAAPVTGTIAPGGVASELSYTLAITSLSD